MASPPFSVNITAPANTDIAANFPTLDRSDKDVFQSWITVLHNNQGRLFQANMDQVGSTNGLGGAPTPPANTATIWYDSTGVLMEQRAATSTTVQVSVPVGGIIAWPAASAPAGYHLCDGSSLSTGGVNANLFAVIGYTWGGSGANFNIPDLRGRAVFGVDGGTGRFGGQVLGNTGGSISTTIAVGNLPNYNLTVSDPGHTHGIQGGTQLAGTGGVTGNVVGQGQGTQSAGATTGITVNSGGSGFGLVVTNPFACMNWIIRVF